MREKALNGTCCSMQHMVMMMETMYPSGQVPYGVQCMSQTSALHLVNALSEGI